MECSEHYTVLICDWPGCPDRRGIDTPAVVAASKSQKQQIRTRADARKCAINAGKFLGETEGEPKATQCIIWLDYISLFGQEEIGAKTFQSPERILLALFAEVA